MRKRLDENLDRLSSLQAVDLVPMLGTTFKKADYITLAAFRRQLRLFLEFSEAAAEATGLTPRHHQALLSIVGRPGKDTISVGELAEHLLIQHNSAVELAGRLAVLGLICRQRDPADRRRVRISLTPRARAILAQMSAVHMEELRRIGPQLIELLGRFGN